MLTKSDDNSNSESNLFRFLFKTLKILSAVLLASSLDLTTSGADLIAPKYGIKICLTLEESGKNLESINLVVFRKPFSEYGPYSSPFLRLKILSEIFAEKDDLNTYESKNLIAELLSKNSLVLLVFLKPA